LTGSTHLVYHSSVQHGTYPITGRFEILGFHIRPDLRHARETGMNPRWKAFREIPERRLYRQWRTPNRPLRATPGLVFSLFLAVLVLFQPIQSVARQKDTLDKTRLDRIDGLVQEAIRNGDSPGAVVLVGRRERIHYRKAFGNRATVPAPEPMTVDTVFDIASLTKVVATTSCIMLLVEQGRIRLNDVVCDFIPQFARKGKSTITIRDLLTHTSGLRPDLDLKERWEGYERAIALAVDEVPLKPPGEQFIYSDINFILLGEILRLVSGMPLDRFAFGNLFQPLGMRDTMFNPPLEMRSRIAPTTPCKGKAWPCGGQDGAVLRGLVHDPTARRMGGVAGHAGLFSTADDLGIFCRMLLGAGGDGTKPILSPLTVATMISPSTPPGEVNVRGLGWDLDSTYSANRGELLPLGSFGHTGFTGTSLWLDPISGLYVVFLSNRVHPAGDGDVTGLRAKMATVAASAVTDLPAASWLVMKSSRTEFRSVRPLHERRSGSVITGIDVVRSEGFASLKGKRLGLLTNHTGLARNGVTTMELIGGEKDLHLVALFSPEHGIEGTRDGAVPSSRHEKTDLPIHSLYGRHLRPTAQMLEGIDTIVVDLQDIGTRFYTYMTTVAYLMEEATRKGTAVVVLDRPNPINGDQIEGGILEPAFHGFTGYFPMPIRHGLTMGELARLFNGEKRIDVALDVVKLQGWQRDQWFDETGLPWVNPSPNIRNLKQATLYPGIGAIEGTNISVGRGTDTPFEQIGAPWIDGVRLAQQLNARGLAGIRFYPVSFTPTESRYAGEACRGVFLLVTDRVALLPVRLGLEIAVLLYRLYPEEYRIEEADKLLGSATLARLMAGEDPACIAEGWRVDEAQWRRMRAPYLLY